MRNKNQDRALCCKAMIGDRSIALGCVCDGIGSLLNSEISSEMVVEGLRRWFQGIINDHPSDIRTQELVQDLELTVRELNELVFQYKAKYSMDIGCTLSLFLGIDRKYYVFHAGDSRIYCRGDRLVQLTHDEVTTRENEGRIRSFLANYIGKKQDLWISKFSGDILDGDLYVIGSDGLYKLLTDEDAVGLKNARKDKEMERECRKLTARVIERGERDNVSCAVLYYKQNGRGR
ncbi:MAG: serine/threonine-protein phosphatase [Lachnospiraceae bacterium]|nr:serine/threonine-protein phosphatase [Lachnospiraceae bacterium]